MSAVGIFKGYFSFWCWRGIVFVWRAAKFVPFCKVCHTLMQKICLRVWRTHMSLLYNSFDGCVSGGLACCIEASFLSAYFWGGILPPVRSVQLTLLPLTVIYQPDQNSTLILLSGSCKCHPHPWTNVVTTCKGRSEWGKSQLCKWIMAVMTSSWSDSSTKGWQAKLIARIFCRFLSSLWLLSLSLIHI